MSPCGASVGFEVLPEGYAVRVDSLYGWDGSSARRVLALAPRAFALGRDCGGARPWAFALGRDGRWRPPVALRRPALLFEPDDGLSAGHGDLTINDGTFGDGDAFGNDVGVYDGGSAHLEFVLDHQLAGNTARNDGRQRMNLTFPLRFCGHAQGSAHTPIAANSPANDEWPARFHITGQMTPFRNEGR